MAIYLGLSLPVSNWSSTNDCRDACWLPDPPLPQPICLLRASRCSHHSFVGSLPPPWHSGVKFTSPLPVALKFRDVEIFNHSLILVAPLSKALSCFTESFMVAVKVYFYNSCIMFMTGVIFSDTT